MMRTRICVTLIFLLVGCSLPATQRSTSPKSEMKENGTSVTATRVSQPSPSVQGALPETKPLQASAPIVLEKKELSKAEQPVPPVTETPLKVVPLTQEKGSSIKPEQKISPPADSSVKKASPPSNKSELAKSISKPAPSKSPIRGREN